LGWICTARRADLATLAEDGRFGFAGERPYVIDVEADNFADAGAGVVRDEHDHVRTDGPQRRVAAQRPT
jgi:hypothetical protein